MFTISLLIKSYLTLALVFLIIETLTRGGMNQDATMPKKTINFIMFSAIYQVLFLVVYSYVKGIYSSLDKPYNNIILLTVITLIIGIVSLFKGTTFNSIKVFPILSIGSSQRKDYTFVKNVLKTSDKGIYKTMKGIHIKIKFISWFYSLLIIPIYYYFYLKDSKADLFSEEMIERFGTAYVLSAFIILFFLLAIAMKIVANIIFNKRQKRMSRITDKIEVSCEQDESNLLKIKDFYIDRILKNWNSLSTGFDFQISQELFNFNNSNNARTVFMRNSKMFSEYKNLIKLLTSFKDINSGESILINNLISFYLDVDTYSADSSRMLCENLYKGMMGEEKIEKKLNGIQNVLCNKTFKGGEHSAEVDCVVVNDNGVYLVEVKNYNADKIVLETSGMLYRYDYGRRERIDTLEQVSRSRDIIKSIVGSNVNVYNIIVFLDPNRKFEIIDEVNNPNLKIVSEDYVAFLFQNQTSNKAETKMAMDKLLESEVPEKTYETININCLKESFKQAMKNDIENLKKMKGVANNSFLISDSFKEVKEDLLKEIKTYQFEFVDHGDVFNYFKVAIDREKKKLEEDVESTCIPNIDYLVHELEEIVQSI